ncbi:hypothetical protein WJX84_010844 [Apatococcus fuscideae]|uniref:UBC core domain-containing protein n=1 Tax=Apatococcus fuscideae TaxID=2026836 RepID=A0AAW1STN2_9CHLO
MSTTARKRLMRDFKRLHIDPPQGVNGSPAPDNIMQWNAVIFGPEDTPWDGTFRLTLEFQEEYPNKAPVVKFKSTMFHPNIYADGGICLDILQNQWSPIYDVSAILTSIQSLLCDPNPNSPANSEAARLYSENRREYNRRVSEGLSDIERAKALLVNNHPVSQRAVIDSLPALVKSKGKSAYVHLASSLLNNLAAQPNDAQVADAWIKAFQALAPSLDRAVLRSKALPVVMAKASASETSVASRLASCALLGALAPRLTREEVEQHFLRRGLTMCQEVDYVVRMCMCDQLAGLAKAVGRDVTAAQILPETLELVKDDDMRVRVAAVGALVGMLEVLPQDLRRSKAMPRLRQLCTENSGEADMARCLSRLMPTIFARVIGEQDNDQEVGSFLSSFRSLSASTDATARQTCASHVFTILQGATARRYATHLHDTLMTMVADQDENVRAALAGQFGDVCRLLGKERCQHYMKRPLLALLGDSTHAVKAAIAKNIGVTAFTSDQVYDNLVPIAVKYLTNGIASVMPAAADAVAASLRTNRRQHQRTELYGRMLRDFAHGRCFMRRCSFLIMAASLLARFSAKYFAEWCLSTVLELSSDPVPLVRLRVCPLMPALRSTLQLPDDAERLDKLSAALVTLSTDPDADVAAAARAVTGEFQSKPVRKKNEASPGADVAFAAFEAADKKKAAEESDMSMFADEIER